MALVAFAALAARYVRPSAWTWPLQALGSFLPFLAAAVAAVAVLRLLRSSRRVRALYLVLLAALAVRFAGPLGATAPPTAADLRLVTFNVPQWAMTLDRIQSDSVEAFLATSRADVLALQESGVYFMDRRATLFEPLRFVVGLTGAPGYRIAQTVQARRQGPTYANQLVLTRLAVDDAADRPFTPGTTAPTVGWARLWLPRRDGPAAPAEGAGDGAKADSVAVAVYSLHLATHGAAKPWRDPAFSLLRPATWRPYLRLYRNGLFERAAQADSVRAMLEREPGPFVVAGDFNATPHEWAFGRIAGARGGLTDVLGRAGRGWSATYPRERPLVRIDHVLASPEWDVVSAHRPRVRASDHRPVAVRLRLRSWPGPPAAARSRTP